MDHNKHSLYIFFVYCRVWFQNLVAMSSLEKFELEFHIETTPKLLYMLIYKPEGLTRWFAHTTLKAPDVYLFKWEDNLQPALLVQTKENDFVIFKWLEDYHQDYLLEMRIKLDELASGVTLLISDYAEPPDVDFSKRWWIARVAQLQRLFNY